MAMHPSNGVSRRTLTGVTVLLLAASLSFAYGHGAAEWIQQGGFKNALGELCCGERDCAELSDADIKITPAGFVWRRIGGGAAVEVKKDDIAGLTWMKVPRRASQERSSTS